ncbi:MAG: MarR family winged helix-turn-helix transcriptional regulator [Ruminococcus sp.]
MCREIIGDIEKAYLLHKLFVKRILEKRLYFQQFLILSYIYENPECTQADIAKHFHVSSATITVSTQKLQKSGFIEKNVLENNLRCKCISVTEKGKSEVIKTRNAFDNYDKNVVFSGIDSAELEIFHECLKKINRNMELAEGIKSSENHDLILSEIIGKLCKDKKGADFNV